MADARHTATDGTEAAAQTPAASSGSPAGAPEPATGRFGGLAAKLALKLPLKLPLKPLSALTGRLAALRSSVPGRPALAWPRPRSVRLPLGDLVVAVGAASLVLSVLWVVTGPSRERVLDRGRATRTVANAATLQLAAETYAAANGGQYPREARALLPWLPEGCAPRNPYTGDRCLFRAAPGEVTWRRLPGEGYLIEAWGRGSAGTCRLAAFGSGTAAPLR